MADRHSALHPPHLRAPRRLASWLLGAGRLGTGLPGAGLLAVGLLIAGWPPEAQAHRRGLYATRAEAEQRAAELRCEGVFQIDKAWMPCANERALHEALQHTH